MPNSNGNIKISRGRLALLQSISQKPSAPTAPDVPESLPGVYKSSDSAERLADKIENRRADAANFAAFLAGDDLALAVAGVDKEIEQISARIAALGAPRQYKAYMRPFRHRRVSCYRLCQAPPFGH